MKPIILTTKEVREKCKHKKTHVSSFSSRTLVCDNCLKLFNRYGKYRYKKIEPEFYGNDLSEY